VRAGSILRTYRGRYALVAWLLSIVLVGLATLERSYVRELSSDHIARIEQRASVLAIAANLKRYLTEVERWLHWSVLSSEVKPGVKLERDLLQLQQTMQQLSGSEWIHEDALSHQLVELMQQDVASLQRAIPDFRLIVGDLSRRFPATLIMEESMCPHAEAVETQLEGMLQELRQQDAVPAEILADLVALRLEWARLLAEFRLLAANRYGLFSGDIAADMQARTINIDARIVVVGDLLTRLMQSALSRHLLEPSQLEALAGHRTAWVQGYDRLQQQLQRPDWRQDLYLLQSELQPILQRFAERLAGLEIEWNAQAAREIQGLTRLAGRLADASTLLAVAMLAVILIGYFSLSRWLLRPIAMTTRALRLEAHGQLEHDLPEPSLEETADLVAAFEELRRQVRIRESRLDHMAHHDALTQLPNRVLFRDRLEHALALARRNQQQVGLMFLDLDRFKQVNDSLGHQIGDRLLMEVAGRLRGCLRASDTVARLSGDEFALLVENVNGSEEMKGLANVVLDVLQRPLHIDGHELHISGSIGIAMSPQDDVTADLLIRDADAAMYEAKRQGRARLQFFSHGLTEAARASLELEQELREAIRQEALSCQFQPIVAAASGRICAAEALPYWQVAGEESRLPVDLHQLIRDTSMGRQLMARMLTDIAALQAGVRQQGHGLLPVSVNLSGQHLHDYEFELLVQRLRHSGVDLQGLVIEITEQALGPDTALVGQHLAGLRRLGVRFALDAFGTGQSALSILRSLSFDQVKIDQRFVRDLTGDDRDARLVRGIIGLAHSFEMQVVADGVSSEAQRDILVEAGCDLLQGPLFGPPGSVDAVIRLLREQGSPAECGHSPSIVPGGSV